MQRKVANYSRPALLAAEKPLPLQTSMIYLPLWKVLNLAKSKRNLRTLVNLPPELLKERHLLPSRMKHPVPCPLTRMLSWMLSMRITTALLDSQL